MSLPWAESISFWANLLLICALIVGVIATFGIIVSSNVKEAALSDSERGAIEQAWARIRWKYRV